MSLNLATILRESAKRYPEKPAIILGDTTLPYAMLDGFARRVAGGDLSVPLDMDRGNVFGAFSESFDLMRTELAAAREREQAAQESKKDLVAQLSHDIRSPLASIAAFVKRAHRELPEDDARREYLEIVLRETERPQMMKARLARLRPTSPGRFSSASLPL